MKKILLGITILLLTATPASAGWLTNVIVGSITDDETFIEEVFKNCAKRYRVRSTEFDTCVVTAMLERDDIRRLLPRR